MQSIVAHAEAISQKGRKSYYREEALVSSFRFEKGHRKKSQKKYSHCQRPSNEEISDKDSV